MVEKTTLRFWFNAPFRTPVTLDSPIIELERQAAGAAMEQAAQHLAGTLSTTATAPWASAGGDSETRYRTLAGDSDQQFVTPLLELGAAGKLCDVLQGGLVDALGPDDADPIEVSVDRDSIRIAVFDNTVALLEWRADISAAAPTIESRVLPSIEAASYTATRLGVELVNAEIIPQVLRSLDDALKHAAIPTGHALANLLSPARRRRKRRLGKALLRGAAFKVFFDAGQQLQHARRLRAWPVDRHSGAGLMWVSRVALHPDQQPGARLLAWAGASAPTATAGNAVRLLAGIGNSVVLGSDNEDGLSNVRAAYRKLQYLYALLDIHGRNITRLYSQFIAQREQALEGALKTLNGIQAHLSYIETQMIDVHGGLQGARLRHVQALSKAWQLPRKVEDIHRKAGLAKDTVERFAQEKNLRYQRIVQFVLAAVGVLAFADVLINITSFANSEQAARHESWGLMKIVQSVAPDSLLTSSGILLIVLIVILGLLFRKG